MFKKLLFAVDFSPYTEKILGCAGELAQVGLRDVTLLYVLASKDYVDYGDEKNPDHLAEVEEANRLLAWLKGSLEENGLEVTGLLKTGRAPRVITEVASEIGADLIFVGAHGKGFIERTTIGSVSEKVLKSADRPVLIQQCRHTRGDGGYACENVCSTLFGNVLVACDFSAYSDLVKPLLLDLAATLCAPVTLLHVKEAKVDGGWSTLDRARADMIEQESSRLRDLAGELGGLCKSVRFEIVEGGPPEAILGYADEMDASLVILGAFGRRGIIKGALGSVVEKVVRGSERPVLVLKNV